LTGQVISRSPLTVGFTTAVTGTLLSGAGCPATGRLSGGSFVARTGGTPGSGTLLFLT
jgi:hypothetical protein